MLINNVFTQTGYGGKADEVLIAPILIGAIGFYLLFPVKPHYQE